MNAAIGQLPSARERAGELAAKLAGATPAVFLDYDGTLTPIVDDPAAATLPEATREAIRSLAGVTPVAVVSGRDLDDVRRLVDVDGIAYAGSHGFDIVGPDGARDQRAPEILPYLAAAEEQLRAALDGVDGVAVERKRFAVAVHYRRAGPAGADAAVRAVDEAVASAGARLRRTGGKKVVELRPAVAWDKGRALLWLLTSLGLDRPDVVPLYVGDDITDEDAFEAIADRGVGIVVRGEDDSRPTAAHYALDDPDEVRALLEELAAAVGRAR